MLLALLLAAVPVEAERAYTMVRYIADDYLVAVGPGGEILTPQEYGEQQNFASQARSDLLAAAAADLAAQADAVRARIDARARPAELVPLAAARRATAARLFAAARLAGARPGQRRAAPRRADAQPTPGGRPRGGGLRDSRRLCRSAAGTGRPLAVGCGHAARP